ncbi:MAG: glycogen debranching protein GlgX [Acidimicrobiales bacterium]
MGVRIWPGEQYPLGATFDGIGTNVAVVSEVAESVQLCLFDAHGSEERVELPEAEGGVWHGYLPDIAAGQRYGFRVHGPYDPSRGQRCNPSKLLLDPYAKSIEGTVQWGQPVFGYQFEHPDAMDETDSSSCMPRSVVVNPFFDWEGDQLLRTPWSDTVIYEVHVKGATITHPGVDDEVKGSYAGVADPAFVEHLVGLGVTAVELLPVHQFVHESHLVEHGLRDYWGYNSIGYFAPHNEYSHRGHGGGQVQDFKQMVKAMHAAGIEVILDVVYNHTAEGNELGPTLCFRGLDNAAYYRLVDDDPRRYKDYTGTGNSLNARNPFVLQLIMDSLRYWVSEMHVDGFRFDLASALARELHEVDRLSAFFDLIHQDPIISQVKLIAEPWDVGEGGYQVGGFPAQWAEWNGRYRDCIRDFWRGTEQTLGEFGYRFTGSSDLYEGGRRRPHASINFVTAHDGFTLRDLVSYENKHNEANGEENRDGADDNRSSGYGAEGPTDDAAIIEVRARQQRNMLVTLLLSQGVPMVVAGDEIGRTQGGNNNGYAQDNAVSWLDWEHIDEELLDFTRKLVHFRLEHRTFRRRSFFQGRPIHGGDVSDVAWFSSAGSEMTDEEWSDGQARSLAMFLNGATLESGRRGEEYSDDSFLLLVNAWEEPVTFTLPAARWGPKWRPVLDTASGFIDDGASLLHAPGETIGVEGRAFVVLTCVPAS